VTIGAADNQLTFAYEGRTLPAQGDAAAPQPADKPSPSADA